MQPETKDPAIQSGAQARSATPSRTHYPVIIIGAGPVGLALASELGSRSIECLLIERNDRVGYAPRAKTTNVRTRTHLRRWGIADRLADASPHGVAYPTDVIFVTRLGGHKLCHIPDAFNCAPERSPFYPEHGQWIPQYKLEHVLRAHVDTLRSVSSRFSTSLIDATQSRDTVNVTLEGQAGTIEVACDYLVGADGARSRVRDIIGAQMHGEYGLSRNYNIVFRAPGLAAAHPHGPGTMYWQVNPQAPSLIGPMDKDDVWFFMPTKLPEGLALSDDDAVALIKDATGIDLPYQIISRDEWVASRLIADKYRDHRIFLAGDACHLHPPFGGYGMNMGIGDAVDIGWKLAANLQGWGGPRLLESYELERRPVHEHVIKEAVANHAVLSNDFWSDGLEADTPEGEALRARVGEDIKRVKVREFYTLGTVLGYAYEQSPVIIGDDSAPCASSGADYLPCSRPGSLAPHAWLRDYSSLYDYFGQGFTLVIGRGADAAEADRVSEEAEASGIPLAIVNLSSEESSSPYEDFLTLVRPDQHVAWRGRAWGKGGFAIVAGMDAALQAAERTPAGSRTPTP